MEIEDLYQIYKSASGVSIDTRTIQQNELFFAIVGDRFDGNEYALKALDLGASFAVVSDQSIQDSRCIFVPDTLTCLQELAQYHRMQLDIPVIALTGSNGKTTSKELLQLVLSTQFKCCCTEGNLNNHIGIPLTLLRFPVDAEIAIVEMGANHVGEIADYCRIVKPTHGFITNIGKAHIGEFGGMHNLIRAKTELFQYLKLNDGFIFFNKKENKIEFAIQDYDKLIDIDEVLDRHYIVETVAYTPSISMHLIQANQVSTIQSKLGGIYNVDNIKMALAIGCYFNIKAKNLEIAITSYSPKNNRSQWVKTDRNQVFLDAYNANPSSVQLAIEYFFALDAKNKICIIGDMFELGAYAEEEHRKVLEVLQNNQNLISDFYLIGESFYALNDPHCYATKETFLAAVELGELTSSHILLKGSRSMKMEELIDYF